MELAELQNSDVIVFYTIKGDFIAIIISSNIL